MAYVYFDDEKLRKKATAVSGSHPLVSSWPSLADLVPGGMLLT
jgi:hypothetical protein